MASMLFVLALGPHVFATVSSAQRSPLDTIGDIMRSASVDSVPDTRKFDAYSNLIGGFSRVPAPAGLQTSRVDPISSFGAAACQRDYNVTCPEQFVALGQTGQCVAGPRYAGPCASDAYTFTLMSDKAKARWSDQCLAKWPCIICDRAYQGCPLGWTKGDVDEVSCVPPAGYTGPCKGAAVFAGYNREMLNQWSSQCGAFWPCDLSLGAQQSEGTSNPVAKDITFS